MLTNSIIFDPDDEEDGFFQFEDMSGVLHPRTEQMEVIVRPGSDGESLRTTGVRAIPSQVVTMHYVEDLEAAKDAIEAYITLIDGLPYEVVQREISYGFFRVLSVVQLPQSRPSFNNINALLPDTEYRQYCLWTLVATEAPEEPGP